MEVIGLDLEGTLISSAVSQIPRPGLFSFLEQCKDITDRVVMFTFVNEQKFREIAQRLVDDGFAPEWFATMEYINWDKIRYKDLNFIPDVNIESVVIIDDQLGCIKRDQLGMMIKIEEFYPELETEDCNAFDPVLKILKEFKYDRL